VGPTKMGISLENEVLPNLKLAKYIIKKVIHLPKTIDEYFWLIIGLFLI
jgi:hypothetical protein